ncbi:AAA family ATPase [Mycolicibacterium sp. XJ2546]
MTAFDRLTAALTERGLKVVPQGDRKARAQCPAHDDGSPSLSIGPRNDGNGVVLTCHADCDTSDVLAALNMRMADLFDDSGLRDIYAPRRNYRYPDGRVVHRKPGKSFPQSGNKKGRALFHGDRIIGSPTVYVVEGEKDVEAIEAIDGTAVCPAMGAGKAHLADWSPLTGLDVIIVGDKDDAGRKHADTIADLLRGIAANVRIVEAAVGKDAADHVAADKGLDDFVAVKMPPPGVTAANGTAARRARIMWASGIEPEPVVWAWEEGDGHGRIAAGSLSIGAGREGTGKSSYAIWLAANITRGTLPGSFYGTPRTVFYIAVEDSWKHTLVPRLIAAGADLSRIGRFEVVSTDDEELSLSLPHDNGLLEREIREHDAALVVIDPLMSVIGERIDTHREREVRSALDPLAKMADRTGAVIFGVAHFNKGSGTDAASLITGSGAFKNVPRSVFGFARDDADEDGGRVMSQVKNSLGRDDLPSLSYGIEAAEVRTRKGIATTGRFVFLGESERSVADVLRDSRTDPEEADERRDAASWIKEYLIEHGGEAPAKEVIAAGQGVGYSVGTLKNARRKVADTKRAGFRDGVHSWILRVGHTVDHVGHTDQKPLPTGPTALPTEPVPAVPAGGATGDSGPSSVTPSAPTSDTSDPPVLTQQTPARPSKPAGFTPPTGPDRCADCGHHTPTQGHRDNCPLNTERKTA